MTLPALVATTGVAVAQAPSASAAVCASDATNTRMPSTILVYRTAQHRVERVNFKTYVKNVLPNEWIPSWPMESLHSGALAVKTFAWYRVLHSTKRTASGQCFHVVDSTGDQVYRPGSATARTNLAVDQTWNERMSRNGAIFSAHYCATAYGCTYWRNGDWLSQYGTRDMGRLPGVTHAQILKRYYSGIVVK